jgi:hypothetical protein
MSFYTTPTGHNLDTARIEMTRVTVARGELQLIRLHAVDTQQCHSRKVKASLEKAGQFRYREIQKKTPKKDA